MSFQTIQTKMPEAYVGLRNVFPEPADFQSLSEKADVIIHKGCILISSYQGPDGGTWKLYWSKETGWLDANFDMIPRWLHGQF